MIQVQQVLKLDITYRGEPFLQVATQPSVGLDIPYHGSPFYVLSSEAVLPTYESSTQLVWNVSVATSQLTGMVIETLSGTDATVNMYYNGVETISVQDPSANISEAWVQVLSYQNPVVQVPYLAVQVLSRWDIGLVHVHSMGVETLSSNNDTTKRPKVFITT